MQHAKFSILGYIFISLFLIVLLSTNPSIAITTEENDGETNNKTYNIDTKNINDPLSTIFTSRDVFNYIDKGNELFDEGKYDQAITYYDKALAIDSNDIEALNDKGAALANLGKHEEALTYYDKVLAIDPHNEYARNQKSITSTAETDDSLASSNVKGFDNAKEKTRELLTYSFNSIFPETGEKFTNNKYGVDMTFPKNWNGFEWKAVFPMAIVSPEGINITDLFSTTINTAADSIAEGIVSGGDILELSEQKMKELNEPVITKLLEYFTERTSSMAIHIYDKQFASHMNSFNSNSTIPIDSQTSLYERHFFSEPTSISCFRKTLDQITLNNNISAEKASDECFLGLDGNKKQENIHYFVLTPNAVVYIRYTYDPEKENDKFLREFEESLKSLSIKNSLPINNQTIQQFMTG